MAKQKTLFPGYGEISLPDTSVSRTIQSQTGSLTFPWGERDLYLLPQQYSGRERAFLKYLLDPEKQAYRARSINRLMGQEPWWTQTRKARKRRKGQGDLDL